MDKPHHALGLSLQGDSQGFKLGPAQANDIVGPSLILFRQLFEPSPGLRNLYC
jgi:hypothetical protein